MAAITRSPIEGHRRPPISTGRTRLTTTGSSYMRVGGIGGGATSHPRGSHARAIARPMLPTRMQSRTLAGVLRARSPSHRRAWPRLARLRDRTAHAADAHAVADPRAHRTRRARHAAHAPRAAPALRDPDGI